MKGSDPTDEDLAPGAIHSAYRKAFALAVFTVVYNVAEGLIAKLGSTLSGSTALWGFGFDSFIESMSGMVMIWRFWNPEIDEESEQFERLEKNASRWVAGSLIILGCYVSLEACVDLYLQHSPKVSLIGIGLALASLLVMPVLFWSKFQTGKAMGSRSLIADSKETLACMLLSVALLIGTGSFYLCAGGGLIRQPVWSSPCLFFGKAT